MKGTTNTKDFRCKGAHARHANKMQGSQIRLES
jgi:hypothetical protein